MRTPYRRWWSGKRPLAEWFAEAYSWCARYSRIVSVDKYAIYKYDPTAKQHRDSCSLIKRAARDRTPPAPGPTPPEVTGIRAAAGAAADPTIVPADPRTILARRRPRPPPRRRRRRDAAIPAADRVPDADDPTADGNRSREHHRADADADPPRRRSTPRPTPPDPDAHAGTARRRRQSRPRHRRRSPLDSDARADARTHSRPDVDPDARAHADADADDRAPDPEPTATPEPTMTRPRPCSASPAPSGSSCHGAHGRVSGLAGRAAQALTLAAVALALGALLDVSSSCRGAGSRVPVRGRRARCSPAPCSSCPPGRCSRGAAVAGIPSLPASSPACIGWARRSRSLLFAAWCGRLARPRAPGR